MRILVYPHDLEIGGSQLNAVELAAAVRDLGHRVVVFGRPGALNRRIAELELPFVESPEPHHRPSPAVIRGLRAAIQTHGIDIVHGYEWPPAIEAHLAVRGGPARAVATVMSMAVAPFLPHTLPLLVGTAQIAAAERAAGRTNVGLLEPPVDVRHNSPDAALPLAQFRRRWRLDPAARSVVCVGRLAHQLKLEGLLAAMSAVAAVDERAPTQLLVVGDGPARDAVRQHAESINARRGRDVVVLTGELEDPRPAYAVADVVLGMGGSALRGMAFGKPLVVQGENGFWRTLTPESLDSFLWTGWYGYGTDAAGGADRLTDQLTGLLADDARRRELGRFARATVLERFSLPRAAALQVTCYQAALSAPGRRGPWDDTAAAARYARHQARTRLRRWAGAHSSDDFNARPVARCAASPDPQSSHLAGAPERSVVLYLAGVSWDAVPGTDRNLVTALATRRDVVWVDPPLSWLTARRSPVPIEAAQDIAPGVTRVRTVAPPGVTRIGVRVLARVLTARRARRALATRGRLTAVVATSPDPVLPHWVRSGATTIYYATDDFVAGASLLHYSGRYLRRARAANVRAADVVLAVSANLADVLAEERPEVGVLHNGCQAEALRGVPQRAPSPTVTLRPPVAGVVGQLNDRLDLDLLEAVADTGASLVLVGPRATRDPHNRRRLDALAARPNVQAVGAQPPATLPAFLAAIDVGLTPYRDTAFNRASFPLKTLEYLAAGRPVVVTGLPGQPAELDGLVTAARGPTDFAAAVLRHLARPSDPDQVTRRQAFARLHSWDARAGQLHRLINDHDTEHSVGGLPV